MNEPKYIKPLAVTIYVIKKNNQDVKYLLIRKCGKKLPGLWQAPCGTVEPGENAIQTALREMYEETGLKPIKLYDVNFVQTFYEQKKDAILFIPVFLAFVEDNQEVKLSPNEHDSFKWLTYEEAISHLEFSEDINALEHIQKYFVLMKPNERFKIEL